MCEQIKTRLRRPFERLMRRSIQNAVAEQGLAATMRALEHACPDVRSQYTSWAVESPYMVTKVRAQQSFQVALAASVLDRLHGGIVVDIGDSAGTHVQYLKSRYPAKPFTFLSVNMDGQAVQRIRGRGLDAVQARAEDFLGMSVKPDVVMSFEMLEHLSDPAVFLHRLAEQTSCRYLIVTVPYLAQSRVGLHHIRQRLEAPVDSERTHLFELSVEDWALLFAHAGWRVSSERIYRQYPRWSWLRVMQPVWRTRDFEGFYGAVLVPDRTWSSRYTSW